MDMHALVDNISHPPILFFLLGMLAILAKSDLEIPPQIAKLLSLYLLFDIGFKGGVELSESGLTPVVGEVMGVCMAFSFLIPIAMYRVLRLKLDVYNAGAIAGTYGSVSAVTFATATAYLSNMGEPFGGYMVAGMALMESPAIIAGLILIRWNVQRDARKVSQEGMLVEQRESVAMGFVPAKTKGINWSHILQEALFNGSVFLLIGSLLIGYTSGHTGKEELAPFTEDIFKGMLCFYMLDMGMLAARRFKDLKKNGAFLTLFGLAFPPVMGMVAIAAAYAMGLQPGDALLLTVLVASASYIAVPAAMRISVPEANMSLLLPMSLGITFTFNIVVGIPLYYTIIHAIW